MGSAELIKALNDVKYSFNSYTMNRPSILLGTASIEDDAYFKETVEKIVNTREWFKAEMKKLGFTFPDSKANFLFASHPKVPAKEIFEAAREKIFMCVTLISLALITICESQSEQMRKWKSS